MIITAKIYSCYQLTYSRIYRDIINRLYPNHPVGDIDLVVDDISDGGTRSIQSQRSMKDYVTRTVRIYEDGKLVHIVGISNTSYDLDKQHEKELDPTKKYKLGTNAYHANTYLKQGIAAIFNYYFSEKENGVKLSFYLLDLDQTYPHNLFNILSYRELQTIGFKVLNIDEIDFTNYNNTGCKLSNAANIAFPSFTKYMNDIALISNKNSGNIPSFLQCKEHLIQGENGELSYYIDKYIYTFKALSAQGYDSLMRLWCMKVLADKEHTDIEFKLGRQYFNYDAKEKSISSKLTGPILETFKKAGIDIQYVTNDEFMYELSLAENSYLKAKAKNEPRNQNLFRNNIRKKGVPTACVVCGNDNPSLLKAAHLWEVSSIKKATDKDINNFININDLSELIDDKSIHKNELFFKKYCLTNSGHNGVWLCANHHDLFDGNYYFFESEMGTIVLRFKDEQQATNFMLNTVEDCRIPKEIFTKATKAFNAQRNITFGNP